MTREAPVTRPKLYLTRRIPQAAEERLAASYDLTINMEERPATREELAQAMATFDAICPNPADRMDGALIGTPGARVKILANYGAGVEHLDLEAAAKAGIAVSNTPGAVTEPTADLALTLILMATRRAGEGERELRAGAWSGWRPTHMVGQSLSGKLLGLVGFGRIGQATAARARAFGMRIGYYARNRVPATEEAALDAVYYGSLDDLAAEADVLSLHTPGGPATRHLIDAARLSRMKPTAVLINTARGPVIDEEALAKALASGVIASAGLDVYEREPAVTPALLTMENVVLLPHLGSATIEARTQMGMQAADNLDAFFAGLPLPDRVV
jgi:lactate dehydrogenase-like 2-hydroxyacid dehydrogenase